MPQSDNHNYNVPNKGDPNWHQPLNDNFRTFDTDIEVRDTDGNKGNYTPKQGAKFLATDTGIVYEGDGNNWVPSLSVSRLIEASASGAADNLVAGHPDNSVGSGVSGATIAGGGGQSNGNFPLPNEVTCDFGTVGGGSGNTAAGSADATVAGGQDNTASGHGAAVGGGELNTASGHNSTIAGGINNIASGRHATVAGGQKQGASGLRAAVGGGRQNNAGGPHSTISGGRSNTAHGEYASVGGGSGNGALGSYAAICGGQGNEANGDHSSVGGGQDNLAPGQHATIPGGRANRARGEYSFAAGRQAQAEHDGAFVWSDDSNNSLLSAKPNEFVAQAAGGFYLFSDANATTGVELTRGSGSWASASSRTLKSDIDPVDTAAVLDGVTDLEISTWQYDDQEGVEHMGPMAEEFADAFDLGADRETIANVDADGVALAAIQGLAEEVEEKDERIDDQTERIAGLEAENAELRDRVAAIEEQLANDDAVTADD